MSGDAPLLLISASNRLLREAARSVLATIDAFIAELRHERDLPSHPASAPSGSPS